MNENFSHSPLNSPEPTDAEGYFERGNGFLDAGAFERAIADFADTYADQNELDYAALQAAVKDGKAEATTEI